MRGPSQLQVPIADKRDIRQNGSPQNAVQRPSISPQREYRRRCEQRKQCADEQNGFQSQRQTEDKVFWSNDQADAQPSNAMKQCRCGNPSRHLLCLPCSSNKQANEDEVEG